MRLIPSIEPFFLVLGADILCPFPLLLSFPRYRRGHGFRKPEEPSWPLVLSDYLAGKRNIEGYVPSQGDVGVFEKVPRPLPADLCHALCWYNHIMSYEKIKVNPSGVKKALGKLWHANVEYTIQSGVTDDKR